MQGSAGCPDPRMNRIDTGLPMPGPCCMRLPQTPVCRIDKAKAPGTLRNAPECRVCEITCPRSLPEKKHLEGVSALSGC